MVPRWSFPLALALAAPLVLSGQTALPLGSLVAGTVASDSEPSAYVFEADRPGFLTVVVRGKGDVDLSLRVTDAMGQLLQDDSDRDLMGDTGAEQTTVALPAAGTYHVLVQSLWQGGGFDIGGSWIPYEGAASTDEDWSPSNATELTLGETTSAQIGGGNDPWDWYAVTAEADGLMAVAVEAPSGDLVLEVFGEADLAEPLSRSDQDMDGVLGNESVAVNVTAGQRIFVKVASFSPGSAELIAYTIRAGVL